LGTFGAGIVAAALCACAGLLLLAAATLRKAMSASTPSAPARPSNLRCFTSPTSFPLDPSGHEWTLPAFRDFDPRTIVAHMEKPRKRDFSLAGL
jgi:hypothetical protein